MKVQHKAQSFLWTSAVLMLCGGCSKSASEQIRLAFSGPGLAAFAVGNPQPELPLVKAPSGFSNVSFYRVLVQGIHLGSAVVGRSSTEPSQNVVLELKTAHRLGYAPLLSYIRMTGHSENGVLTDVKQAVTVSHLASLVFEEESVWGKDSANQFRLLSGKPENHLLRLGLRAGKNLSASAQADKNPKLQLPFFDYKKAGQTDGRMYLNPLNGQTLFPTDVSVKYAADGVADELRIPWFSGINLEFKRETADELEKITASLPQIPVELAWFSTPATIQEDLRTLQSIAAAGTQFARHSEKLIRKEFPQLPYLFHRKLFNFSKLCETIISELSTANARKVSADQTLMQIGWVMRNTLSEDHRELPRSLVNSPELEVLADDSKRWQWAKIISNMLTQTNEELGQVLAIEDSQKVNVAVRMSSRSLARGSVVKGMLRSGQLLIRHQVENAAAQNLNPASLLTLPATITQPLKVALNQSVRNQTSLKASASQSVAPAFEFVNGQSFAKGDFPSLSPLCEGFRGRIGLDLGHSRNELFSSAVVRGVWDESTRVQLVRQFARRASANPACRDIVLRAPGELATAAKSELESFRRDILQTEMEFQISVGSNRTVRLVPGTYQLVISSLINGSVLGKREIIIPQGHDNLVLNLQL